MKPTVLHKIAAPRALLDTTDADAHLPHQESLIPNLSATSWIQESRCGSSLAHNNPSARAASSSSFRAAGI
eukprot:3673394-Pleurochrysis_carterae.AAC.3